MGQADSELAKSSATPSGGSRAEKYVSITHHAARLRPCCCASSTSPTSRPSAVLWLCAYRSEKDVEILALRHQLAVPLRQLGDQDPQLRLEDKALRPLTSCRPPALAGRGVARRGAGLGGPPRAHASHRFATPPEQYRRELERFLRSEEHIPDWLRDTAAHA